MKEIEINLSTPGVTLGPDILRTVFAMEDVRDPPFITEEFTIDLLGNDGKPPFSGNFGIAAADCTICISV